MLGLLTIDHDVHIDLVKYMFSHVTQIHLHLYVSICICMYMVYMDAYTNIIGCMCF